MTGPAPLRFGLLGTGFWAAEVHAAGLAANPDARFVGVWGRAPAKAAALAGRYGVRAYDDVDALLADVDAVCVALPPDRQAELAVVAAEAGRHLLLEKPLALSVAAADRVVAAVEAHGVASVVFFTNRFQRPTVDFLDEVVRTGGWDGARVTMLASIFGPDSPFASSPWRRVQGGLWDIGPHALAMVLPVFGPVTDVRAMDGPHATTHLILRHESGAVTTAALTLDAPPAASADEVVFHGAAGRWVAPAREPDLAATFRTAVSELVAAVAGGRMEHPLDVRFGREVVAVLEAADAAR